MKKLSLLAAAIICSTVTFAQTTTPATPPATAGQMKDLRHDIRDTRKDKANAAKDIKQGDTKTPKPILKI